MLWRNRQQGHYMQGVICNSVTNMSENRYQILLFFLSFFLSFFPSFFLPSFLPSFLPFFLSFFLSFFLFPPLRYLVLGWFTCDRL